MHKIMDYICDELDELEKKVGKDHKLTMQEVQYIDLLAHTKKNLLKAEEMMEGGNSYAMPAEYYKGGSYRGSYDNGSYRGTYEGSYDGGSYARGRGRNANRDSMGRYASDGYSREGRLMGKLQQQIDAAPDERTRRILQDLMAEMQGNQ